MIYENDKFEISEEYMKMSISELRYEREKILKEWRIINMKKENEIIDKSVELNELDSAMKELKNITEETLKQMNE